MKAIAMSVKTKQSLLKAIILLAFTLALIFLFSLILNINIITKTNDNIFTVDQIDKLTVDFDCILILGAGIRKDGTPTPMLNDRLTVALEAFTNEKTDLILLSGDSEYSDYTETVTMRNVLIENGIDGDRIISDGYGLSTYESIWRAKYVYGYNKILIISQKYHLHRAIYIAQELGISAYGIDGALRGYAKQPIYSIREYFARMKDMIYAEIRTTPKYTEQWEGIDG